MSKNNKIFVKNDYSVANKRYLSYLNGMSSDIKNMKERLNDFITIGKENVKSDSFDKLFERLEIYINSLSYLESIINEVSDKISSGNSEVVNIMGSVDEISDLSLDEIESNLKYLEQQLVFINISSNSSLNPVVIDIRKKTIRNIIESLKAQKALLEGLLLGISAKDTASSITIAALNTKASNFNSNIG